VGSWHSEEGPNRIAEGRSLTKRAANIGKTFEGEVTQEWPGNKKEKEKNRQGQRDPENLARAPGFAIKERDKPEWRRTKMNSGGGGANTIGGNKQQGDPLQHLY